MTTLHEYTPAELDAIDGVIERLAVAKLDACADRVLSDLIALDCADAVPAPQVTSGEVARIIARGPLAQQYGQAPRSDEEADLSRPDRFEMQ